jgi:hypothetical protein
VGGKLEISDLKIEKKNKGIPDGIPFCVGIQKNNRGWWPVKGVLPMRLNP